MTRRTAWALSGGVLIASAAAWPALSGLAWPARAFTVFLLVPLPAVLILQATVADRIPEEADRESVYLSSAISVWVLAALAMLAARASGFSRGELGLRSLDIPTLLLAAGLALGAGLLLMAAARLMRLDETPLLEFLIPRTSDEKIAFAGLSISAGIAEELVFRGFLIAAVIRAGGSLGAAAAVSVAAFALTHAYQGVTGVIRVALLGVIVTAPLLMTGSLYPSMLAHAALDLVAGLLLGEWLTRGGDEH